jgi:hypothetical protein
MRRRALLTSLVGSTALLSGCIADAPTGNSEDTHSEDSGTSSTSSSLREVFNPTGQATIRPLDEPLIQRGLTAESEQYLYGGLFYPGDAVPVTDSADATWLAETVDELSSDQLAVLTNLRTAGASPAHFWPSPTGAAWGDEGVQIHFERQTITSTVETDEAVGVALTVYQYTGEQPTDVSLIFPSGATLSIGT